MLSDENVFLEGDMPIDLDTLDRLERDNFKLAKTKPPKAKNISISKKDLTILVGSCATVLNSFTDDPIFDTADPILDTSGPILDTAGPIFATSHTTTTPRFSLVERLRGGCVSSSVISNDQPLEGSPIHISDLVRDAVSELPGRTLVDDITVETLLVNNESGAIAPDIGETITTTPRELHGVVSLHGVVNSQHTSIDIGGTLHYEEDRSNIYRIEMPTFRNIHVTAPNNTRFEIQLSESGTPIVKLSHPGMPDIYFPAYLTPEDIQWPH